MLPLSLSLSLFILFPPIPLVERKMDIIESIQWNRLFIEALRCVWHIAQPMNISTFDGRRQCANCAISACLCQPNGNRHTADHNNRSMIFMNFSLCLSETLLCSNVIRVSDMPHGACNAFHAGPGVRPFVCVGGGANGSHIFVVAHIT